MVGMYRQGGRVATFKGKHNASKAIVLLLLGSFETPFNARGVSNLTGLTLNAAWCLLRRLSCWHYVTKRKHNGVYVYGLAKRGAQFIEYIPAQVHNKAIKVIEKRLKRA